MRPSQPREGHRTPNQCYGSPETPFVPCTPLGLTHIRMYGVSR